jgi:hypothetical protein
MGRPKKSAPAPVELEPEEISQEEPDEEEPDTEEDDEPDASGKAISKAAAVRDALEQGEDGPEDGVAYIKKIHGIEMTRQMFSSYKAQEKARQAKKQEAAPKAKPGRKPREASAEPAAPARAVRPEPTGDGDMIDDLAAVKHLVQKLGAEQVRKIVGLFE